MSDVCREFGISRKTGYKIFNRYKDEGLEALTDRSRRPVRYANQLPAQIETQIVSSKKSKPHWGARKIRELLVRKLAGDMRIPSTSTVHAILDRHGLVTHARHRHHNKAEGTALSYPLAPNDLWCVDFKGEFKLGNGRYCYPLMVTDRASRYLLAYEAFESTKEALSSRPSADCLPSVACRTRSEATTASPSPARTASTICRSFPSGGSGSASPSNASGRAIRNRTAITNACT